MSQKLQNLNKAYEDFAKSEEYYQLIKAGKIRDNKPKNDFNKFREVLLYILNKCQNKENVGSSVISKLLYFIDFNYYELYEEQLIGATYIKNLHGPTPRNYTHWIKKMEKAQDISILTRIFHGLKQIKYYTHKKPNLSLLKNEEISVIDNVLVSLSDMSASQIEAYSHEDIPYIIADEKQDLSYEAVFNRTKEYSLRKDD